MIEECSQCKRKFDSAVFPSTSCSSCKEIFCGSIQNKCFCDWHDEHECSGSFKTILNPGWVINLRSNKDIGGAKSA